MDSSAQPKVNTIDVLVMPLPRFTTAQRGLLFKPLIRLTAMP